MAMAMAPQMALATVLLRIADGAADAAARAADDDDEGGPDGFGLARSQMPIHFLTATSLVLVALETNGGGSKRPNVRLRLRLRSRL
jgi:hypothetical protein